MALESYLAQEVALDHADGLISRREALRRLALMGIGAPLALALLSACGGEAPRVATTRQATTTPAAPATATSAASPATATSPEASEAITFPGPSSTLQAAWAEAVPAKAGVLVIHENRGLTDHFRSLVARLASDGYSALAVDLLSEEGGTAALGGNATAALSAAPLDRLIEDMRAALTELEGRVAGKKTGIMGFCFGGGMVWSLLAGGEPRLAAAVPFYGPAPSSPDFSGSRAAVFAIYAEMDSRVNASQGSVRAALEKTGLIHQITTYPGVDHAFFNDTGARYDAATAATAYGDVLAFFAQHLA